MPRPSCGLFVTGTGTDVGKTYVACAVLRELRARGVRVGAYKPACSGGRLGPGGTEVFSDVVALGEACGGTAAPEKVCPQCFSAPLAPPSAAALEGRTVDRDLLTAGASWWASRCDVLVVEGVGGLLCPLTRRETVADFAAELGYPLLIVARAGLGTINHTLLTLEAAASRGLRVAGIVLNQLHAGTTREAADSALAEIADRTTVPVLARIPHESSAHLPPANWARTIDWRALADCEPSR